MKTILFSQEDIRKVVSHVGIDSFMDQMIKRFYAALREFDAEKNPTPKRSGFQYTSPIVGLLEWMPVMQVGEHITVKIVGYHPENPDKKQLPTILSTISFFDATSGHLIGLADGTFLTAVRTGAASGVASDLLAHPDSKVIGLIGAGAQAITQLHAVLRVRRIEEVLVYDTDDAAAQSFQQRAADIHSNIRVASLDELTEGSDIICTATSVGIGEGPVFEDRNLKPWVHVNAVGADFPGKIEVPLSLLKRSAVCPDFLAQTSVEGECQQLAPGEIGPNLAELAQQAERFSELQQQPTVFDSTGWALEDQVAMALLMEIAEPAGAGTLIQLESISDDPLDPYKFLNDAENTSRGAKVSATESLDKVRA